MGKAAKFDVFLSHNWLEDENGVSNHDRVAVINEELKALGYSTWFDVEQMEGNIASDMSVGIEKSAVILVFVTKVYEDKVKGTYGNKDNCYLEFGYSCTKHAGDATIIPVVMEKRMGRSDQWEGQLGLHLANVLHVRMAFDFSNAARLSGGMAELKKAIDRKLGRDPAPEPALKHEWVMKTDWIVRHRGEDMPAGAICAGETGTDGPVYVGRFRGTPGKVNVGNRQSNQIYNFWVQNEGSRVEGEVLVTNGKVKWVPVGRGDPIPATAVFSGRDSAGDKVWVGRSKVQGEPGKINCHDNASKSPKMWNLWCHSGGRSSDAELLTIFK